MLSGPIEWEDLRVNWPLVRDRLQEIDLERYCPHNPLVITAAKSSDSTRPLHMLHPQDMIFYTSLTLLLKNDIEASRVPLGEERT